MHLSITNNVTPAEKEELFVGLRAYNGQFLDMATFSGDLDPPFPDSFCILS